MDTSPPAARHPSNHRSSHRAINKLNLVRYIFFAQSIDCCAFLRSEDCASEGVRNRWTARIDRLCITLVSRVNSPDNSQDGASLVEPDWPLGSSDHQSKNRPIVLDLFNLSKFSLKMLSVGADTVCSSSLFHILIILSVKKCWRRSLLKRFFLSLRCDPVFCYWRRHRHDIAIIKTIHTPNGRVGVQSKKREVHR